MSGVNKGVAIITGGGSGIGRAISLELSRNNCNVVILDMNIKQAERVCGEIRDTSGSNVLPLKVNVADSSSVQEAVDTVFEKFRRVDILINNAGHAHSDFIEDISDSDWNKMLAVHLTGTFNCSRAVIKNMKGRKSGRIINIASIYGMTGEPQWTHYSAAKAGIMGFTKALAKEVAPYNILVNAIAPGSIKTPLQDGLDQKVLDDLLRNIPLKRFGSPEEIAFLVAFLVSEKCNYITGQVISPNGGSHIIGI